ncbi:hypothetical protein C8Q77DRAFT_1073683 [Trametes polyzona]|nr:hypothetical protein C8Q77DRAFT_1073683 [Trametes polyzona]
MSSLDSTVVSEIVADYQYINTFNVLLIASIGREVRYIWQEERKWPQRVLYVLNRYAQLLESLLFLGTIIPISDARGGLDCLPSNVHIVGLWIIPVNLPPPDNCTFSYGASSTLITALTVIGNSEAAIALAITTIVLWRKTQNSMGQLLCSVSSHGRPTLPQLMFIYGMSYTCVMMAMVIANATLTLLSATNPTADDLYNYIGFFDEPIISILMSHLILDLFETNAKIERGGASNTGSFSVNLNSGRLPRTGGSISIPVFANSYVRPNPSSSHNDDDGDAGPIGATSDAVEEGLQVESGHEAATMIEGEERVGTEMVA